MIDYATWRHECVLEFHGQPSVLTPMQRNVFWCIASGRKLTTIASDLMISLRTVEVHKHAIQERIPGLKSFASYGVLAVEIMHEYGPPYFGHLIRMKFSAPDYPGTFRDDQ